MLQAQTYVYDKNVLAVLRIHIFLVAVVIVGFVRAVCLEETGGERTRQRREETEGGQHKLQNKVI